MLKTMRSLSKGASISVAGLILLALSAASAQTSTEGLELSLTVQPLVVRSEDPVSIVLQVKNRGTQRILLPSWFKLFEISPYGAVSLQYRPRGVGAYNSGGQATFSPLYPASRATVDSLLTAREFVILRPGHFVGREITTVTRERFPVPPGLYEIRLQYIGSDLNDLIAEARQEGIVLPKGEFFSNVVVLEVRP